MGYLYSTLYLKPILPTEITWACILWTPWITNYIYIKRPWASYQIRKIAVCACAGNAGNVFPRRRLHRKPLVSDPGMHHGTCVTHVPWCMSASLTRGDGKKLPAIPGACAAAILRIWQEAHCEKWPSGPLGSEWTPIDASHPIVIQDPVWSSSRSGHSCHFQYNGSM